MFLMTVISAERYLMVFRPDVVRRITLRARFAAIGACVVLGVVCASMPLLGWSHYSLESGLTSCAIEWSERSLDVVSFNVFVFGAVYAGPLGVIVATNLRLIVFINQSYRRKSVLISRSRANSLTLARQANFVIRKMSIVAVQDEPLRTKALKTTLILGVYIRKSNIISSNITYRKTSHFEKWLKSNFIFYDMTQL